MEEQQSITQDDVGKLPEATEPAAPEKTPDDAVPHKPMAIESINREMLQAFSAEDLQGLLNYMTSMRVILMHKMEIVHMVKEEKVALEKKQVEADKMSDADAMAMELALANRKARNQSLAGDHITKDGEEEMSAGGKQASEEA